MNDDNTGINGMKWFLYENCEEKEKFWVVKEKNTKTKEVFTL